MVEVKEASRLQGQSSDPTSREAWRRTVSWRDHVKVGGKDGGGGEGGQGLGTWAPE